MDAYKKIEAVISNSDFCVVYEPIGAEIIPHAMPFALPTTIATVSLDKNADPKAFGAEVAKKFYGSRGFIIVPGKKFDRFGGRHGRGWGWYDRFLSSVPADWVRIGICSKKLFSETRLVLNAWDESVDWVIVADDGKFSFYETHARDVLPLILPSAK